MTITCIDNDTNTELEFVCGLMRPWLNIGLVERISWGFFLLFFFFVCFFIVKFVSKCYIKFSNIAEFF